MKTGVKLLLVSIMSLSLVGLPVLADAKGGHGYSLKEKFFHKAHFILVHQKSLELTEGEVESIKALKMAPTLPSPRGRGDKGMIIK